ncbi:MAG: hypothetical protein AAGA90_13450 [Actinomycetota bacterium]
MGAIVATGRVVVLVLAILASGCSAAPPAARAPVVRSPPAPATVAPFAPSDADLAFVWPAVGWLELRVDVFVAIDAGTEIATTVSMAAWWEPRRVEVRIDAPDPDDPDTHLTVHDVATGPAADRLVDGLRGRFEAGRTAGVVPDGMGPLGGMRFVATHRDHDMTASERWEIGSGPAPWGTGDPPVGRS